MTAYRRLITQPGLAGEAALLTSRISYRRRKASKIRREAELLGWEEEGGSLLVPATTLKSS